MAHQEANTDTLLDILRNLPPEIMALPLRTRMTYARACRDSIDLSEWVAEYLWMQRTFGGLSPRQKSEFAEYRAKLNEAARTKIYIEDFAGIL